MDLEFVPKVFVLTYEISEEDHGLICVFPSFELAKLAKEYAEKSAKASNTIDFYVNYGFCLKNLDKK